MTTIAKVAKSGARAPITKKTLLEAKERLEELRQAQSEAREEELKIRTFLADKLYQEEGGSKTLTVEGLKLTIGRPLAYSISKEELERMTADHGTIADEVIRYKPEVKVGEFKKHPELAEYVTVKPGPATVEFK